MLKLPSALWLGVLLSAGCFRASPPGSGAAGAGGAVVKSDAGQVCVENQLCIRGSHWDTQLCKCVPDEVAGSTAAAGGGAPVCVETVLCVRDAHWDSVLCQCILDSPDAGAGAAQRCQAASDCNGPLPHLCASCINANGGPQGSACAHWICSDGSCQTAICE
jgi:hypothetical protein